MVAGWPVRMPNWLKMASRITAKATQSRICFVKSFKFHLQPQTKGENERAPPNLHHPKLPRQQIDLTAAGS